MVASIEKYCLLFPVFVAFLSIFFVWFYMQRRRKHGATLDEDKTLTEEIKANFNPDALSTSSGTQHYEKNISEKCEEETDLEDEREVERRIQKEQLKEIYKLMERNKEKYGNSSMEDVNEQMKRYKT